MQFHENGYVTGEPRVKAPAGVGIDRPAALPAAMDVLIVGEGPAGMITAAQLSQFPDIDARLVERRPEQLLVGQADGIQARSVETFQAFGFANRVIDEGYHITEMSFWKPSTENPENIVRTAVAEDDANGVSEFPHLIINQARVMQYFAEVMRNSPSRMVPNYGIEYLSHSIDESQEHPIEVRLRTVETGEEFAVRTRYLVGADGARSQIRRDIGATRQGKQAAHAWGVIDSLSVTDFPDWRVKCAIQSHDGGSILHIPREGGQLTRMYVDLGEVAEDDNHAVRETPMSEVIARANEILHPYTVDVKHIAWSSVYEVGHRVTDRFDDVPADQIGTREPRVFILGDACHTHSAKAGQGMNVSMQDGFNLGWKLAHVLLGVAPQQLLRSYTGERQEIAQNLIDFDMTWSSMMAKRPEDFDSPTELEDFYVRTAEFPAGFMTEYKNSLVCGTADHQDLAAGYPVGKRFKSFKVSRRAEGNTVELGHLAEADGKWRIYVFADAPKAGEDSGVSRLGEWLATDAASPLVGKDLGGRKRREWFDAKVIYQQRHLEFELRDAPEAFRPTYGAFDLMQYENVFGTAPEGDIFEARGISRDGAIVVVRPDQYVAQVLPLSATDELAAFFEGVMPHA
ncbi:3-hydroxybenzoate 4-monooxygenase [Galactobacter valiniphilus]|uniref:3-hydroxybenzoate 4-monooxygenase n=1 Tax=Galactobacter valiniphilus TaxID=2676122 RepID=A0A399JBS5_9MICC|nr:FAD-dependent monooxygenase [Galactobacter valiniphilus]RII42510.1 3-hydroxybenzoate 4-monooxygenase [Galactobacter valiniphilus]